MIAIVGGPAERQLRQVAGADDQATDLVRQIHENLGPLSGLGILIGDVMVLWVLTDIGKVLMDSGINTDCAETDTEFTSKGLLHYPGSCR